MSQAECAVMSEDDRPKQEFGIGTWIMILIVLVFVVAL